jgi:hypothetical protein
MGGSLNDVRTTLASDSKEFEILRALLLNGNSTVEGYVFRNRLNDYLINPFLEINNQLIYLHHKRLLVKISLSQIKKQSY